jgi:zinc protease
MRSRLYQMLWGLGLLLAMAGPGHTEVLRATLDNGLTVLIEENHANPVVAVEVFVRTGSLYEQEYLGSGISHFFEHIIHGGTTSTRSEEESRRLLESMGNNSNAYTTVDHTAYYINTTTEHWRTAVELLADWMLHSSITPAEFEREKGVVQRELEQDLDNPEQMLAQIAMETRFQVHPARYPVIGYKELVQKVSRDDLVRYYQRMYTPNNMLVVVVGDVQTSEVLTHMRETFGQGARRPLPAISLPEEPPQLGKRTVVKEMAVSQASMSLSFRTVALTHPHLYPLDVLAYILGHGNSARLVRRIQEEQQLVYTIQADSYTPAYAAGAMSVSAALAAEQVPAAEVAILQELYRLREELVSPEELAKAKKQKVADYVFERQTVEQQAHALGLNMLSTYDPNFSETYVRNIQQVTAEDIREVARLYFREEALVQAVVRPTSDTPSALAPTPVAPREPVVKKILANGMTLLLKRNPALPTVAMQAYFKGGVRVETSDTNGLSLLTASLLLKGTTSRSAEEIATMFDARGATVTAESGNNSFFVNATCLREDFDELFQVYADIILHPSFPDDELTKMRRLLLAALERHNDDWRTEIERLWRQLFFTVSPYRLASEGTVETLQRFQRQDVVAFYQRYVVPGNMVLAIVGDIDLAQTAATVENAFHTLLARPVVFPEVPAEPPPTQVRRQVKQTQKQVAAIYIGFPGTTLTNLADRYPLQILDGIVSGLDLPGGWLHNALRGQQLVYVVHAFSWLGLESGYFGVYAATQPDTVHTVVDMILQNLEKARAGQISDEEVDNTKQMALVTTRLRRQANDQIASDMALNELYGLGYDFSDQEAEHIAKVTRADVQRVAQTYLHHPTIVITTPGPF